jgi:hypothetical protein
MTDRQIVVKVREYFATAALAKGTRLAPH